MAFTATSAGIVQRKAYNALYGTGTGTSTDSVSPYHWFALKHFFIFWGANKSNADLQFIPYTAEQATTANDGTSLVGGPCTLYVWWGKARRTTGTTAAFEALFNGTAGGGDTDPVNAEIAVQRINAANQQFLLIHPNGWTVSADVSINSTTAINGTTESSAANSTDGFIIVGQ